MGLFDKLASGGKTAKHQDPTVLSQKIYDCLREQASSNNVLFT